VLSGVGWVGGGGGGGGGGGVLWGGAGGGRSVWHLKPGVQLSKNDRESEGGGGASLILQSEGGESPTRRNLAESFVK